MLFVGQVQRPASTKPVDSGSSLTSAATRSWNAVSILTRQHGRRAHGRGRDSRARARCGGRASQSIHAALTAGSTNSSHRSISTSTSMKYRTSAGRALPQHLLIHPCALTTGRKVIRRSPMRRCAEQRCVRAGQGVEEPHQQCHERGVVGAEGQDLREVRVAGHPDDWWTAPRAAGRSLMGDLWSGRARRSRERSLMGSFVGEGGARISLGAAPCGLRSWTEGRRPCPDQQPSRGVTNPGVRMGGHRAGVAAVPSTPRSHGRRR